MIPGEDKEEPLQVINKENNEGLGLPSPSVEL